MKALTSKQIQAIKKVINEHMNILTKILIGEGKPSPALLSKLGIPKELHGLVEDSYMYGRLSVLKGKDLSKMSPAQITKLMQKMILSPSQRRAMDYSKMKAQLALNTLHTKITTSTLTNAIQEQIVLYTAIQDAVPDALEHYTDRYKVIQHMRESSKDWNRDWYRVAHTEMWDAKNHGEADAIAHNESPYSTDGGDTKVFVRVAPNGCPQCKRLYLEQDRITPRVFKLSDLVANGSNYGKKTKDWKAVVPTCHPNCMCVLNVMPKGYHFNIQGELEKDINKERNKK